MRRRSPIRWACRTWPFALVLAACSGSPLGPVDPAVLREPQLLHACGDWVGGTPPAGEHILVDVWFGRRSANDPDDRPTAAQRALIFQHGGWIVYRFHFPAVRALLPTRNVPKLAASPDLVSVLRVADPQRRDWPVIVGYRSPYSYAEGAASFVQVGGRVDRRYESINAIAGLIPDRSVRALRMDPRVEYVEGAAPFPHCE